MSKPCMGIAVNAHLLRLQVLFSKPARAALVGYDCHIKCVKKNSQIVGGTLEIVYNNLILNNIIKTSFLRTLFAWSCNRCWVALGVNSNSYGVGIRRWDII